MKIAGRATPEGTSALAFRTDAASDNFRSASGLLVSSLGFGTYGGNETSEPRYEEALARALEGGCNVVDTAVAYRDQLSERLVGRVLSRLIAGARIPRNAIVVCSKAGFLPFDDRYDGTPEQYIEETLIRPGIIGHSDIVAGRHCITPSFLRHQVDLSRENLNLETIDFYFLHNPETQLREVSADEFGLRMCAAMESLELLASEGKIGSYGVAAYMGFRVDRNSAHLLTMAKLLQYAENVGGEHHRFRAVLIPFSLDMLEAYSVQNQFVCGRFLSSLDAARELGLAVFGGSPLHLGRLSHETETTFHSYPPCERMSPAQFALQFARSAPGLATSLVGMSDPAHVEENLALLKMPRLIAENFSEVWV